MLYLILWVIVNFRELISFSLLFTGFINKLCNDKHVYMYNDLVLSNISLTDTGYIYELLLNIATCPGVSSPMINQPVIKSHS